MKNYFVTVTDKSTGENLGNYYYSSDKEFADNKALEINKLDSIYNAIVVEY